MRRRSKIALAVVFLVGAAAIASVVRSAGRERAVTVRAETAVERDLVAVVRASGWIRPFRAVDVQADLMGRVIELHVAEGDAVERGRLLLRLDPSQYEAMVARAKAAVSEARAREAQARAGLIQAEQALRRTRAIRDRDSTLISAQTLEEAETQHQVQQALAEAAQHGIAQAEAALREAEDLLAKTVIRAPIAGIVTRLNVEEGETAIVGTMNNPGSLLLTISDMARMEAVLRVHETDVPAIQVGDSAGVEIDAFPRRVFGGRVTRISHSAVRPPSAAAGAAAGGQPQAIDFEVVVTLDEPPAGLRPDLSATGDVVTARRDRALSVPIIALTVRELGELEPLAHEDPETRAAATDLGARRDQEGVFLIRESRATFVPVEVGITGLEHFEIVAGLTPGDSVIAGPYDAIRRLENGTLVRPMARDGAARP